MEKNKLKAVIFDLDGVITDSAKYHYLAWKELADSLNIPFDEEYNEKLKGVSRMDSLELILKNDPQKRSFTDEEKAKFANDKNENYKELIKQITPEDTLPGISEFLKELKDAGVKTALASVSKNAGFIINQLQIGDYFDYMADAAKIVNTKPAPDIFLDCRDNLGFESKNCIGVEDAKSGVEAIHRAGMKAIGVGTADQMKEADFAMGTEDLKLQKLLDLLNMEI